MEKWMKSTNMMFILMMVMVMIVPVTAFADEAKQVIELTAGVKHVPNGTTTDGNPVFNTYVDREALPESVKNFVRVGVASSNAPFQVSEYKYNDFMGYSQMYDKYFGSSVPRPGVYYTLTVLYDADKNPLAYEVSKVDVSGNATIPEKPATSTIDHLEASEKEIMLALNQSTKLKVYSVATNGMEKEITNDKNVVFRSDSTSIVDVQKGIVKAGKKEGTANITISYAGKKLSIPVKVNKTSMSSLKSSLKAVELVEEELEQVRLTAILSDGSVKDVTSQAVWTTDNSRVADVETGEIEAKLEGSAVITANYNGLSVDIAVQVVAADEEEDGFSGIVALEASNKNIKMTGKQNKVLQIYAVYEDGSKEEVTDKVLWQTSKSDVAEVEDGVLTAGIAGKAIITATLEDQSIQLTVQVVKEKPIKHIITSTKSVTLKRGAEKELMLTAVYTDGSKADVSDYAIWSSKNDNIAEVEGGIITAKSKGTTVVMAKYNGKYVNVVVNVSK